MRAYVTFLCIIGIAAALAVAMPNLMIVAFVTLIGIPVAVLLYVAPTLAMYLIPAFLLWRLAARDPRLLWLAGGLKGWLGSILILVAAGWLISIPSHRAVNAQLDALASGDKPLAEKPVLSGTVAYLHNHHDNRCAEFCQRLLLSGTATRVLLAHANDRTIPPDDSVQATSWHMERRQTCPKADLGANFGTMLLPADDISPWEQQPVDLMMQQIVSGNCLVQGDATLAEASAIIQTQRVEPASGEPVRAGIFTAQRTALFLRGTTGLTEVYRLTSARGYAIRAPLFVAFTGGYEMDMGTAGLARIPLRRNDTYGYDLGPDLVEFALETLGLSLEVEHPDRADLAAQITSFLADPAPMTVTQAEMLAQYFDRIDPWQPVPATDRELLLALLRDDTPLLPNLGAKAVPAAKDAPPDYFAALAKAAFQRAISPGTPPTDPAAVDHYAALATIISRLPAPALAPYKDNLIRIALDRALRVPMWQALPRLGDFGDDGARILLWLVVDPEGLGAGKDWRHPYLTGMTGLCQMGSEAGVVLDQLADFFVSGKMTSDPIFLDLTVTTLARIGLTKEKMTTLWLKAGRGENTKELDATYARSSSENACK